MCPCLVPPFLRVFVPSFCSVAVHILALQRFEKARELNGAWRRRSGNSRIHKGTGTKCRRERAQQGSTSSSLALHPLFGRTDGWRRGIVINCHLLEGPKLVTD